MPLITEITTTSTATGRRGYPGYKKDLFSIWAAHEPSYVATVIGSEPLDLARKIETARGLKGPRMIIALAPCPTGWDYDPRESVEIGKLAVKSGVWPLKEYRDGKVVHTKAPRERLPVEAYLQTQGRFAHLFSPRTNTDLIAEIQAPPFDRIGVMDLESVFPSKERAGFAMTLNNLLASPGFAAQAPLSSDARPAPCLCPAALSGTHRLALPPCRWSQ